MSKRVLLESLAVLVLLAVFFGERLYVRSEAWSMLASVAQVIASLLLVLLLARWHWTLHLERRWTEMGLKSVLCSCCALGALLLLRSSPHEHSKTVLAIADLLFMFGLLGAVLFVVITAAVLRRVHIPV